jgi:7-carboxy-7-deazaguanine synthase
MRVIEIFNSIDGEVNYWGQGTLTTFIRTAGCNLACKFCDTAASQPENSGQELTIPEITAAVKDLGCKKVTITGGEPLLQADIYKLISVLIMDGYLISVETNGTIRPDIFGPQICWVVDYKLHDMDKMLTTTFMGLSKSDWIKFVVGSEVECYAAEEIMLKLKQVCDAKFAFSPLLPKFPVAQLLAFLQRRCLWDVRVNVQIHKLTNVR